jgi:hypothetical protein
VALGSSVLREFVRKRLGVEQRDPDMAVARVKVWGVRFGLLGSALALVATSGPPHYADTFTLSVMGTSVELSSGAPRARFLIRARALELSEKRQSTTNGANAFVRGTVVTSGGQGLVRVRLVDPSRPSDPGGSAEMNVVTSFGLSRGLSFHGDCAAPGSEDPCEAELELELERIEGASSESTSRVDWDIEFTSSVSKDKGESEQFQLPWVVAIEPL